MYAGVVGVRLGLELVFDVLNSTPTEWPQWGAIPSYDWYMEALKEAAKVEARELREELCPGMSTPNPQRKPLSAYTGRYWNAGYHGMNVESQDGRLFINATDRSNAFTLTFEHMCKQTQYVASMYNWYDMDYGEGAATFQIDEHGDVVKMGLDLDGDMDDYIWFDKQSSLDERYALYDSREEQVVLACHQSDGKRSKSRSANRSKSTSGRRLHKG